MTTLIPSSCFLAGIIAGACLVRYGFGLGVKATQRLGEGRTLTEKEAEIDYDHTGGEEIEDNQDT